MTDRPILLENVPNYYQSEHPPLNSCVPTTAANYSAFRVDAIATTWKDHMYEIDSGTPVFHIVDSDKDGIEDHAVAGIGYEQREENEWWYAYYESFSEDDAENYPAVDVAEGVFAKYLKWSPFVSLQTATLLLFTAGLAGITDYNSAKKRRETASGAR